MKVILCFILILYIILNDLSEYVEMHHLLHKLDYIRFSFIIGIGYFVGLYLVVEKRNWWGLLLIVVAYYNTSLFKNGMITPSNAPITSVDFVLLTTHSNRWRQVEFMKRWPLGHLHVYYSLEGSRPFETVKDHPVLYEFLVNKTGLHNARNNNSYNLAMGLKRGLRINFTLPRTKQWVAVFEDDAVLNPRFPRLIQPALDYYKGYDVIWGDVTTHADFIYKNQFLHCTSSMIYNQASMEKIARLFDFERPEFKSLVKHWPYGNTPPYVIDSVIAYNCNVGLLKCGYAPLTHEANDWSSSIGKSPWKY